MKDYNSFIIPQSHLDYFYKEKRTLYRYKYFKKHGKFPTEEQVKDFTIPKEEIESFKQMVYAKYCENDYTVNLPTTPNIPVIPDDSNNDKPNEETSGNGNTNMPSNKEIYGKIICIYDIITSGDTHLYSYLPKEDILIEKITYESEVIIPTSANTFTGMTTNNKFANYNFNKLGEVTIEIYLKNGVTSLDNIYFSNTRIKKLILPKDLTKLHSENATGLFSGNNGSIINEIISLNEIAPKINYSSYNQYENDFKDVSSNGTLYVPKGATLNYVSWMGDGITDNLLAKKGWTIKELDC